MRYSAEHKQRTHRRVLKEAAKVIRREGPHRVGVAGVMAKVGLTHGGFYAHFRSKDDLVVSAMAQMINEAMETFDHFTIGKAPAEALRAYIDFYLSPQHRDAYDTGCLLPALSSDLPRLGRAARERFALGVERLTGAIEALVSALGHAGAGEIASSTLAEMVGAISLARGIPDLRRSDALLKRSRELLKARLGITEKT